MEKFFKYTEIFERKTIMLLLAFNHFKKKINRFELKLYIGLYILLLIFFQWYYFGVLSNASNNPISINISVILLLIPTTWVIILCFRMLFFEIFPKYKRFSKKTIALKKELKNANSTSSNTKDLALNTQNNVERTQTRKLKLNDGFSHSYITSELEKLLNEDIKLMRSFVYHHFETSDWRKKFRTLSVRKHIPEIKINRDRYIEFYWVLYKGKVLSNSFTEISEFLINTHGKIENSAFYNKSVSTIQGIPSEKDFHKKYSKEPSLRTFFNQNSK
ncbi:hypothetical protein FF125_01690 [Aureibaculum algae]|uniref:Uncharacterized protein n=1 Tax=Aureibaculum algae TaxID=2584122 RepID=A0A5B7TPX0_9FLAO|nr:hypothetical protein [Aureibaculum algae]QCX37213.1 hypothetical protein FF125_01690 [Aureibaculum algae]